MEAVRRDRMRKEERMAVIDGMISSRRETTIRDVALELGVSPTTAMAYLMDACERRGYIYARGKCINPHINSGEGEDHGEH